MKKILVLFLVLLMVSFAFVACNDEGNATDSSDVTVETTEESTVAETTEDSSDTVETQEPEVPATPIIENKKTTYTIVIPDKPTAELEAAVKNLRSAFSDNYGVTVSMYKESTFKTLHGGTMDGSKIVIGGLDNESRSMEIQNSLDCDSFVIKMTMGSLYIVGGDVWATISAIDHFISEYISDSNPVLKFDNGFVCENNDVFPLGNLTVGGNLLSNYTIVSSNSYYAKQVAEKIQSELISLVGKVLPIVSDDQSATNLEILVGKTNRAESKAVRAAYERPNVNYDIVEKNGKLVMMAEGFSTLEVVSNEFVKYLDGLSNNHNIVGTAVSGDILISDNQDNVAEGNMLQRAENTDVRVMAWNMGGPGTYGKADLAEKLADAILKNLPDVFGTNEFYDPAAGAYRTTFDIVMREISEYYYEIESENDFPNDSRIESFVKNRGPRPQKIFIRKDAGLKVIAAGWRYTEYAESIDYRSFPWAVLETKAGDRFIYTVSHYTNMSKDNEAAIEQLRTVAYAQAQSGSSKTLPAILSGDLWTSPGAGAYATFTQAGYKDAQKTAAVNDNLNTSHSTFHDYGELQPTGRAITDLMFYTAGITPLKFKVITSREAIDSSDHSPLVCDFAFS